MKTTRTLLSLSLLLSAAGTLRAMDAADTNAMHHTPPAEESPASKRIRELEEEKSKLAAAREARRNSLTGHEADAEVVEQALIKLNRKVREAEDALAQSTTSCAKQTNKAKQRFAEALEVFRAAKAAHDQTLADISAKLTEAKSAHRAAISSIEADKAAQQASKTAALEAAKRSSAAQLAHAETIADYTQRQERLAAGRREVPGLFGLLQ